MRKHPNTLEGKYGSVSTDEQLNKVVIPPDRCGEVEFESIPLNHDIWRTDHFDLIYREFFKEPIVSILFRLPLPPPFR